MKKEELIKKIQTYMNGMETVIDVEVPENADHLEAFYCRTAKRLISGFTLYKKNPVFRDDFLITLRDFLLIFETGLKLDQGIIPDENDYAIKMDEATGEYFCTFQFPQGVISDFAEKAFMRGVLEVGERKKEEFNLMTDSLIYQVTGLKSFKSMSQKLAVYGALNTPDGYTTLVSLPTGGGKSLITQMLAYQSDGLTIVIVPTVSLADDQMIAARSIIKVGNPDQEIFEYKSGLSIAPILNGIQNRTARLLFISPEALMNNPAFETVVSAANKQHYLKNIVIDEAHIVVDWGASFRVDYQCIEAWRRNLMLTNPVLRTLLLSATFENKCIEILKKLFSDGEKWIEVRCDALRHEPRYMVIREKSFKQKDKKTVELVQKLPHPMILYVAKPDDAERVRLLLEENGIRNVHTYTGLTKNDQREKLLKSWKANEFEIMIATSAFGVGVDKPDVRTVIHLYVPQNPNAYYQELGRGGRDQLPCLSVMCTYPDDIHITFQRINKRVMTAEKIAGRWNSMYNNKSSIRSGNVIHINTAIKPNYSAKDEWDDRPPSDADMNWNIYVLLLFRRYDLINIISITNDKGIYIISVEIKNSVLVSGGKAQDELIERIRSEEWDYYNDAYRIMERAIKSDYTTCWSQMFFDTYDRINEYCAGCNAHLKINNSDSGAFSLKRPIKIPIREIFADQRKVFEGQDELVIIARTDEKENAVRYLEQLRVSCLIASEPMLDELRYFESIISKRNMYVVGRNGARELLKRGNYYYISGVVAVLYPDDSKEIWEIYRMIRQYLCHRQGIQVVHILSGNVFIPSAGKNITDLIEGRVITADTLCEKG